ncbi:MAG: carboxyl transferase domain-containing protein, partial [Actinomycetota bacterium]
MSDDRHDWGPLLGDLAERRARALAMGGPAAVDRQHALGKLTVRERLDLLCDAGTFVEYGLLADHMDPVLGDRSLAADGVVTGLGAVDGRPVAIAAYDFTVLAGTMGDIGEDKVARMRALAVERRMPFVWLLDSAGRHVRIDVRPDLLGELEPPSRPRGLVTDRLQGAPVDDVH